ncbi:MAG: ABC transporter permease subunit [Clostridiales bacterium]|nr:ABC transporter permease subunit [Clostridiales bacterium]
MNINPVFLRELRVRMRGWKLPAIIVIYLAIMASVSIFMLKIGTGKDLSFIYVNPDKFTATYTYLSIIQFMLILFIAPSLTAGAISGEREKQTLDIMLSTPLSPISIIFGKLLSSISQIMLLIIVSLPVFSVVFLFGGISLLDMGELFAFYILTALTLGALGLFFSTFFKRSSVSGVASYGAMAFLILGTLLLSAMYMYSYVERTGKPMAFTPILLYINPMAGFASLLADQFGTGISVMRLFGNSVSANAGGMPLWEGNMIFDGCIIVITLLLSIVKINPVRKNIFKRRPS